MHQSKRDINTTKNQDKILTAPYRRMGSSHPTSKFKSTIRHEIRHICSDSAFGKILVLCKVVDIVKKFIYVKSKDPFSWSRVWQHNLLVMHSVWQSIFLSHIADIWKNYLKNLVVKLYEDITELKWEFLSKFHRIEVLQRHFVFSYYYNKPHRIRAFVNSPQISPTYLQVRNATLLRNLLSLTLLFLDSTALRFPTCCIFICIAFSTAADLLANVISCSAGLPCILKRWWYYQLQSLMFHQE